MSDFLKMSKHSLLYGLGEAGNRVLVILLLPIYTRYLTPGDFGVWSILFVTEQLVCAVARFGIGPAVFREVNLRNEDEATALSTALVFQLVLGVVFCGALFLGAPLVARLVFGGPAFTHLFRLVFAASFVNFLTAMYMTRLRMHDRSARFAVFATARMLGKATLNILFVVAFRKGVDGLILAGFLNSCLFALLAGAFLSGSLRLAFSRRLLAPMVRFGGPLVFTAVAAMIMNYADRFFLQRLTTERVVGIYSLGYSVGMGLGLVVQAVELAWPARLYRIAGQEDAARRIARITTQYTALVGFAGLALAAMSREILLLLATPAFYSAGTVVPLVVLSYLFAGLGNMADVGIHLRGKTRFLAWTVVTGAVLNLGLNALLIPRWGMLGAAWATVFSFAFMLVVRVAINRRLYPVPYEAGRLLKVLGALAALYALSRCLDAAGPWFVSLPAKTLLLAGFPAVLWFLRFYAPEEARRLRSWAGPFFPGGLPEAGGTVPRNPEKGAR